MKTRAAPSRSTLNSIAVFHPFKLENSEKWGAAGESPWDLISGKLQAAWIRMQCQAECVTGRRREKHLLFCRCWWKGESWSIWCCLSQQCSCLTATQNLHRENTNRAIPSRPRLEVFPSRRGSRRFTNTSRVIECQTEWNKMRVCPYLCPLVRQLPHTVERPLQEKAGRWLEGRRVPAGRWIDRGWDGKMEPMEEQQSLYLHAQNIRNTGSKELTSDWNYNYWIWAPLHWAHCV